MWKETRNQAVLVVKTKLLYIENGEELRECMTSFYLEHVKDIELLSRLHAENDQSVFMYVLDRLKNERGAQAVQMQALEMASKLDEETLDVSDSDEIEIDYVDPFVLQ